MRAKHFKLKIKQACHNNVGRGCEKQQQRTAAEVAVCPKSLEVAVINQLHGHVPAFLPEAVVPAPGYRPFTEIYKKKKKDQPF